MNTSASFLESHPDAARELREILLANHGVPMDQPIAIHGPPPCLQIRTHCIDGVYMINDEPALNAAGEPAASMAECVIPARLSAPVLYSLPAIPPGE